jgi:hypothetical protein
MGEALLPRLRRGRRRRAVSRLTACLAVAALVLTAGGAAAQSLRESAETNGAAIAAEPKREYFIKAAILYNFAKFTRWPAAAFEDGDAPLRLCVLGVDPFGKALATIDGKRVGTRLLRTRLIPDLSDVGDCHLLFVSTSEDAHLDDVLAATHDAAILTVADIPDFSQAGGIITLKIVDDRTRFLVNRLAADRAGLVLSAKLLRLAETVIQD